MMVLKDAVSISMIHVLNKIWNVNADIELYALTLPCGCKYRDNKKAVAYSWKKYNKTTGEMQN